MFVMILILGSNSVSAQPSSPHEVTGEVKDNRGNTLDNISVEIRGEGDIIASTVSDNEGSYSLQVLKDDVGEEFRVFARDEIRETIDFTAFSSDNVDIVIQVEDEQNQESENSDTTGGAGGGGGGGGGGFAPTNTNNENGFAQNNTNISENLTGGALNYTENSSNINDTERIAINEDGDAQESSNLEDNQTLTQENTSESNETRVEDEENNSNLITGLFSGESSGIGSIISGVSNLFSGLIDTVF